MILHRYVELQFSNFLKSLIVNKNRKVSSTSLCGYTSFSSPDTQNWDADKRTQDIPTLPLQGPWDNYLLFALCYGPRVWNSINTPWNNVLRKCPVVIVQTITSTRGYVQNFESYRIWFALTAGLWKSVKLASWLLWPAKRWSPEALMPYLTRPPEGSV